MVNPFCYVLQDKMLNLAIIKQNLLIEATQDGLKNSRPKHFATLTKDLTFSITKTQILECKKYKFSIQLKIRGKDPINLIIDGKQDLDFFFRKFSEFGMATGLQQMVVSCQKVGQGSFAEVYKVITNYDSVMALKAFYRKALRIHKNKLAFQNQVDVMRLLNNKYIVSLDGIYETDKSIYLKMEYFSLSLKHYLKKFISIKTQKKIMKQLLEALVQMKNKNIVHRDLKPQNIMIRGKSESVMQCVIIDLGLSTPVNIEKYIFNRCGTPGFLAPEIANMSTKKEKISPACDMFSLGCIFYKVLTTKYLFTAGNYNQVIEKNKSVQIPWQTFVSFSQNGITIPIFLENCLIRKMLQKDPSKRILPEEALLHEYFNNQVDDDDELPNEDCDLMKKMKNMLSASCSSRRQSMSQIMSLFHQNSHNSLTSEFGVEVGNKSRLKYKDSCLSFDGPVKIKHSIDLKNSENKMQGQIEQIKKYNHIKKRASRFSQIKQVPLL